MNRLAYFEVQAGDTRRAIDFYKKVFGWRFKKDSGIPIEYWRIEGGGIMGSLLKRQGRAPQHKLGETNAFVCSIEVKDFDQTAKKIKGSGGKIAHKKFAIPSRCWQGYFIDTEGNIFGIFQVDETAK
jgi:uncharacterized protein